MPISLTNTWQQQLSECISDVSTLLSRLKIDPQQIPFDCHASFAMRVPQSFAARMEPGNPFDPLLLQVLPLKTEQTIAPGYSDDPLSEKDANKLPGLLHKYKNRVLLLLTSGCAINCRYCFRRNFPYQKNILSNNHMEDIINYLQNDLCINEVILSGGDPLILKDELLANIIHQLQQVPHLKYLRIHSRLPIMIPDRITHDFINLLKNSRFKTTLVVHCNHPNEINFEVQNALEKLRFHNITLFNQSVLLRGVNNCAKTLIELSYKLHDSGVIPYYLHLLDPVQGTTHFAVTEAEGLEIIQQLSEQLPGFLVPKFVKEIAYAKNKIPITR